MVTNRRCVSRAIFYTPPRIEFSHNNSIGGTKTLSTALQKTNQTVSFCKEEVIRHVQLNSARNFAQAQKHRADT